MVSWIFAAACMDAPAPAPPAAAEPAERAPAVSELEVEAGALLAGDSAVPAKFCCTDWGCPSTGYETTGCTGGNPSPSAARAQCNAVCEEACVFLGTVCDE